MHAVLISEMNCGNILQALDTEILGRVGVEYFNEIFSLSAHRSICIVYSRSTVTCNE